MSFSNSLIVLHDEDDLACVRAADPQALSGRVLAFDTDIHLRLEMEHIDHLTPWDIITPDELPQLQRFEAAILSHWTTHARIDFEGMNLLGMAAFRHVSALARLAWAAYALRRVIEQLQPATVFAFDEPASHGLDQPADHRKMPLLFGILRFLGERTGAQTRLIPRPRANGPASFDDQIARRDMRRLTPVDVGTHLGDHPYILFHANGPDAVRQLPLIRALRTESDCQVVQLYKDVSDGSLAKMQECGHRVWHESQVTGAAPCDDIGATCEEALRRFAAASASTEHELRAVFDNPYIASHFDFLFGDYARKMAHHVRNWRRFFDDHHPAAFVANYHAPIFDVAAASNIPCLGLTHGLMMIGQPKWFQSLPGASNIGAISALHRDRLIEHGISSNRIQVTGDPFGTEIAAAMRRAAGDAPSAKLLRKRLGIASDQPIILLCTGSFGMPSKTTCLPLIDFADGVRAMYDLGEVIRRRPEWRFVVKCHPRFDYPELYQDVNRNLPPSQKLIIADQPLSALVAVADATCVWSTITSALIEASLADKPVIVFARPLMWYDANAWGTDGWLHLTAMADFEAQLDDMFTNPARYDACLEQTRRAVARYLGDTATTAVTRCVDVISQLAPPTLAMR